MFIGAYSMSSQVQRLMNALIDSDACYAFIKQKFARKFIQCSLM